MWLALALVAPLTFADPSTGPVRISTVSGAPLTADEHRPADRLNGTGQSFTKLALSPELREALLQMQRELQQGSPVPVLPPGGPLSGPRTRALPGVKSTVPMIPEASRAPAPSASPGSSLSRADQDRLDKERAIRRFDDQQRLEVQRDLSDLLRQSR